MFLESAKPIYLLCIEPFAEHKKKEISRQAAYTLAELKRKNQDK